MENRRRQPKCTECGTDNAPGSKFCETCGVSLPRIDRTAEPREEVADRGTRVAIARELARARRLVKAMRILCGVLGGMWAIVALLLAAALGSGFASEEARQVGPLLLAIAAAAASMLLAGAWFLHLAPLTWTVTLAALFSLDSALTLWSGELPLVAGFIAVCLWCATPIMLSVHRLMRDHPTLVDSDQLRRRRARDVATSEARARAEERALVRSRSQLRTAGVVGGIAAGLILVVWLIASLGDDELTAGERTQPVRLSPAQLETLAAALPAAIAAFRHSWQASDLGAIERTFTADRQVTFWPKVHGLLQRRGWDDDLPEILEPEVFARGQTERDVHFELLPKGTLKTRWSYEQDRWQLTRLVLANTR